MTGVERYPKAAFPTQQVHGPTPDRALRLITCGGSFDYAKRSYRDNIVVYAVRTGLGGDGRPARPPPPARRTGRRGATSSSWLPSSTTRPRSRTAIRSA